MFIKFPQKIIMKPTRRKFSGQKNQESCQKDSSVPDLDLNLGPAAHLAPSENKRPTSGFVKINMAKYDSGSSLPVYVSHNSSLIYQVNHN